MAAGPNSGPASQSSVVADTAYGSGDYFSA